jgi:hypothetical protein
MAGGILTAVGKMLFIMVGRVVFCGLGVWRWAAGPGQYDPDVGVIPGLLRYGPGLSRGVQPSAGGNRAGTKAEHLPCGTLLPGRRVVFAIVADENSMNRD